MRTQPGRADSSYVAEHPSAGKSVMGSACAGRHARARRLEVVQPMRQMRMPE